MGLFNLFKKKKSVTITLSTPSSKTTENYNPWAKTKLSRNDDYATAAFIAMSENGSKIGTSNDDYPRYLSYDFHVYDPIKYHKKVLAEGYLVEAPPEIALKKMKVDQLKGILVKSGLSDKGKKDVLIARISESMDTSSLGLEKYYVPSEKGKAHLKKNGFALTLRNYGITWAEYDEFKKTKPDYLKPNDIIWQLLSARMNDNNVNGSYGLARNNLLYMAKLLESEKRYVDALHFYAEVLYYDTNGIGDNGTLTDNLMIAPSIIESIHRLKDFYDPKIIDKCYNFFLPNFYISRKNFERLLFDIFDDKVIDIENYVILPKG